MERVAQHKRIVGLDIHQAQITAGALIEEADDRTRMEQRQFGGFKRGRRERASWVSLLHPDEEIFDALHGDLTASHQCVVDELMHPT